jgi:hypothetical protein
LSSRKNARFFVGQPPFPYFTEGEFIIEIDQLFDIALDVVICVGYLVRAVLPPGQFGGFDAYCPVQQIAIAAIYLAEWAVNSVISLGTIQYTVGQNYFIDPNCNWEARNCVPQVTQLGFFKDGVRFINGVAGLPGGACSDNFAGGPCSPTHSTDQGLGGLIMCVCNVLNTIIPIRPNPSAGVGPGNCPTVDICCPLRQLSFATGTGKRLFGVVIFPVRTRAEGACSDGIFLFLVILRSCLANARHERNSLHLRLARPYHRLATLGWGVPFCVHGILLLQRKRLRRPSCMRHLAAGHYAVDRHNLPVHLSSVPVV